MSYSGGPLTTPVPAVTLLLLPAARDGALVICAGAGLSVAPDANLPSGRRLGELLDARLCARLEGYVSPENTANLLAVADAAAGAAGGLLPLQIEVLELADFERATPNYGHRALGLLLSEGAVVTLLLWNWDDCVERSAGDEERLQVARTREDMAQLRVPRIAKVHGCATRVRTLLITSAQLEEPPPWAEEAFAAELRGATSVFIGIGDVADYAQRRLRELRDAFPNLDIYVVSPDIGASWDDSVWSDVVPELQDERRIAKTADAFLDELARAWALELTEAVERLTSDVNAECGRGVTRVLSAFKEKCGADVIAWCRDAAFRKRVGESVVRSTEAPEALIALGVLAAERGAEPAALPDGRVTLSEVPFETLLVFGGATATDVRAEAERRAQKLAGRGLIGEQATFVVAGTVVGPLHVPESPDVVEGEVDPMDLVRGPSAVSIEYISSADVLRRVA
jgi:SIR2-like domain